MRQYLDLLRDVREHGVKKSDRTGVGTVSIFGRQMRFNLADGFPAVTTKKLYTRGMIYELLWFLRGDTNIKYLKDHGVGIWDDWADEKGDLGPIYGAQWRRWDTPDGRTVDQISQVINEIKTKPHSRRLIVSAWNEPALERMKLPPCHCLFQFYVAQPEPHTLSEPAGESKGTLSCQLYQRSADLFLGVPFNIASYALLTMMVAQVTGLTPGEFVHTFGDAHIYLNHLEQVDLQLSREPRPLPTMAINPAVKSIFDFKYEDFELKNYDPHPAIKAPIAV